MAAQQHGAQLSQRVSRYVSVETTSPVVETEEVTFEIMLLLVAFLSDYIYIGLRICWFFYFFDSS